MARAVIFAVCLVGALATIPSASFSEDAQKKLASFVSGAAVNDAASAFFAASVAHRLGFDISNKQAVCALTSSLNENNLADAHHAYAAHRLLGCPAAKVSASLIEKIKDRVDESEDLNELSHAVKLYALFAEDKHVKLSKSACQSVISRVGDLQHTKGSFRLTADADEGSYLASAKAWSTIAVCAGAKLQLDDDDLLALITASEGVTPMLKASEASSPSGQLVIPSPLGSSALHTTSSAVVGITRLAAALDMDLDVSAQQMSKLASFILSNQGAIHTLSDAFDFVEAVFSLADNTIAVPLAASVKQSVLQQSAASSGPLTLVVTDLFGKFAVPAKVSVVRAGAKGAVAPLLTNQPVAAAKDASEQNTEYSFNFFSAKPEPGVYDIEYSIIPEGSTKFSAVSSTVRTVKVAASATIAPATVAVTDASGRELSSQTVEVNKQLAQPLKLDTSNTLTLSVDVRSASTNKPFRPHQAFVRFEGPSGTEAYFALKVHSNKQLVLALNIQQAAAEFANISGSYRVTIIIADANLLASTAWDLGEVSLTFPAVPATTTATASAYKALPVIEHKFRVPEKRPPVSVSSLFTGLVAAPAGLLLIALLRIGFNFSGFPGGFGAIFSLAFVGIIVASMLLIAAYWFTLSIFQTLNGLALLAPVAILVGNQALSAIQQARLGGK